MGLARAAIGASRRFVQPPGVVDEELIALLQQALDQTPREPSVTRVRLLNNLSAALYFSERREEMRRLSAEATVNTTTPAMNMFRGPKMSPSRPEVIKSTAYIRL